MGQALQEGQLQRAQQAYQARRDELVRRLNALNHTALAVGEGLHLWLPVRSETAAAQLMAQRGWLVQGGEPFRLKGDPAIRVSRQRRAGAAGAAGAGSGRRHACQRGDQLGRRQALLRQQLQ